MTIERANEVLVKCTHLTFANRERLSINVRQLSQNAIVTLFQMLDILESKEGSLINLGFKFTKRGECRVRIGKNIIISIPDAGSRKEFQTKLLRHWTMHDRYIWYSEDDKLEVLSKMEFDGELKDKNPLYDVIHTDVCEDESDTFPDLSDVSLDEAIEPKTVGTIGMNAAGRGSNKANLAAVIALATNQMTGMTRTHMRVVPADEAPTFNEHITKTAREAMTLAIENDKRFNDTDNSKPHVIVGSPGVSYNSNDPSGIVACIKQHVDETTSKNHVIIEDDELPW